MTLPYYTALAKQFIKETEAAASHGLIRGVHGEFIKAAINLALETERAASSDGQVPPDLADGTGRGSLSAQRTRKL